MSATRATVHTPTLFFTFRKETNGRISVPLLSGALELLNGLKPEAVTDEISPLLERCHSGDAAKLIAELHRSGQGMTPCRMIFRVISGSGGFTALELKATPRRNESRPEVVEWQGVASSLLSGLVIHDKEHLFETLLDSIPVPVFYKNRQGQYVGCNHAFEDFLGCTKEQMIGKSVFELSPPELAKIYYAQDESLFAEGGIQRYEAKVMDRAGAVHEVIFNKAVFADGQGNPAGLIGAILDVTERNQAERKLKKALHFAEGMIAAIPDILFEVDRDGRYRQVWTRNQGLLSHQRETLLGRTVDELLPPDAASAAMKAIQEADENGACYGHLIPVTQQTGELRWFEHSVAKMQDDDPAAAARFVVLSRDVTARKQAKDDIDGARRRLLTVIQTIPDMVWLKDEEGGYLLCNHAFEHLVGKSAAEICGKTDDDLFDTELARFFCERDKEVMAGGRIRLNEEWVTCRDSGEAILLETRKVPVFAEDGAVTGILGVARDITELNASRQEIHRLAFYDPLTSLPNRVLFNGRLLQMIADAARLGRPAGVMLIDLDHFKTVNDTMGHPIGDELLGQAAQRLTACMPAPNTVARLGGDEFAILVPEIQDGDDLVRIAERVLDEFNEQFLLQGKEVFMSCSIGVALYPDDSKDANDLVKYADSAMYSAKRSGRSRVCFYSKDLTASAEEYMVLEAALRRAIERRELELHYQPKILLKTGMTIGSEALLRWRHPEMGLVPPMRFIRIAEESGLIEHLGRWVLGEACRTAVELNAGGQTLHKVAINLSARECQSQDLAGTVAGILAETGCRPEWIEIEITERLLLDQKTAALETLSALRAMGITIAIDDFGTGYSALSYLAHFPIDTLKVDRSFINGAANCPKAQELVKAILSIARCLGQEVVAEGVETSEQAEFLVANGCDAAQGFFYSKPVTKAEMLMRCAVTAIPCPTSCGRRWD